MEEKLQVLRLNHMDVVLNTNSKSNEIFKSRWPHRLRPFLLKGANRQGKLRYVYLQSRDSKFH